VFSAFGNKGPIEVDHRKVLGHILDACAAWEDLALVNCEEGQRVIVAKVFSYLSLYYSIIRHHKANINEEKCSELITIIVNRHFEEQSHVFYYDYVMTEHADPHVVACYARSYYLRRQSESDKNLQPLSVIMNFIADCGATRVVYKNLFAGESCTILPICQYFLLCYAAKLCQHEKFRQASYDTTIQEVQSLVREVALQNDYVSNPLPAYFSSDDNDLVDDPRYIENVKQTYKEKARSTETIFAERDWLHPAREFLALLQEKLTTDDHDRVPGYQQATGQQKLIFEPGDIIGVYGSIPPKNSYERSDYDLDIVVAVQNLAGQYEQRKYVHTLLLLRVLRGIDGRKPPPLGDTGYLPYMSSTLNDAKLRNPVVPFQIELRHPDKPTIFKLDIIVGVAMANVALRRADFMGKAMPKFPGEASTGSEREKLWCTKIVTKLDDAGIKTFHRRQRDFASALFAIHSVVTSAVSTPSQKRAAVKKRNKSDAVITKRLFLWFMFGQRRWMQTIHNCGFWQNPGADPLTMISHVTFDEDISPVLKQAVIDSGTLVEALFPEVV
tara:strand:- start:67 stop:1731 length:1665 start_codon:yes stop_codon:yes gene_type:complete